VRASMMPMCLTCTYTIEHSTNPSVPKWASQGCELFLAMQFIGAFGIARWRVLQILMAHGQVVERSAEGEAASAGTSDTAGRGPSVRIIFGGNMWAELGRSCCGG
jgi:hypothetical protein